jgi:hypothetical protein
MNEWPATPKWPMGVVSAILTLGTSSTKNPCERTRVIFRQRRHNWLTDGQTCQQFKLRGGLIGTF